MASLSISRAVIRTLALLVQGRVHFPRLRIGQHLVLPDGRSYRVFREVRVDRLPDDPEHPGAVIIPYFHVRRMSPRAYIWFSWLPVWIILGLPGFRSKLWMMHAPTGDFAGKYEWDTVEDAENYEHSAAMKFMTRRLDPASVSSKVFSASSFSARGI